jgi:Na+-driven multidrug efflux pump
MFPVRLGLALSLRPMLGVDALWWSFPAGSLATLVGAALYYRYGPWRRGTLRVPQAEAEATSTSAEPAGVPRAAT